MSKKNVGIWIRVSTEDQAKGDSPEHHEERARFYAKAREWNVVEVYNLEGVSGKKVLDHPEAQRMLQDVLTGKINGLIFSKLARLARNTRELLDISDFFRDRDADLISLEEAIDTSSPAGRLFYTVISAVAQWEREEIASRVKASVPVRAKMGKRTGGSDFLGYKWHHNELKIDEKEAPLRKLIFELYAKERRKKTVARILNEKGYRTKKGKEFSSQTITQIIRNPISKGLRRVNYTTHKNGKLLTKPEDEWIFVKAPAIISEELWDECNRIMDEQTPKRNRPAKRVTHLFSSHLRCHCGGKMYVPSNSPKYVCRKCRNKISKDDMEVIFHEQLRSFLFSQEDIEKYKSEAKKMLIDKQKEMEALKKKISTVENEITNLIRLNTKGILSDNDFSKQYQPISQQLEQLNANIPSIQGELDILSQHLRNNDYMLDEARDLHSRWEGLSFEDKRRIVELIVQDIIIGSDEMEINLLCSPSSIPTPHPLLKGGKRGNYPLSENEQILF